EAAGLLTPHDLYTHGVPHDSSQPPQAPTTRAEASAARKTAGKPKADVRDALERHNRRITWMDVLRGLAILLVILHHTTQIVAYRVDEVPEFFAFISAFFAPYRMPMLMFLSGLLV